MGSGDDGSSLEGAAPLAAAPAEVTRLLNEAGRGDPSAAAALLPLVYKQLRRLARANMRRERSDQTLQATALVHEAYLRLVDQTNVRHWSGRWHFFAAAAEAMRRILVEQARRRNRLKRGGGVRPVSLDAGNQQQQQPGIIIDAPPEDLLALDEALAEFAAEYPDKAQVVKLRYFAGLSIAETAEAMGISPATADRWWAYARAWLYRRMSGPDGRGC